VTSRLARFPREHLFGVKAQKAARLTCQSEGVDTPKLSGRADELAMRSDGRDAYKDVAERPECSPAGPAAEGALGPGPARIESVDSALVVEPGFIGLQYVRKPKARRFKLLRRRLVFWQGLDRGGRALRGRPERMLAGRPGSTSSSSAFDARSRGPCDSGADPLPAGRPVMQPNFFRQTLLAPAAHVPVVYPPGA
jgi:hypothetical protein